MLLIPIPYLRSGILAVRTGVAAASLHQGTSLVSDYRCGRPSSTRQFPVAALTQVLLTSFRCSLGSDAISQRARVMIDVADGQISACGHQAYWPHPYGAGQPMIGTLLMLFFGLPSMRRSL
jgi:hypothetical protein